MTYIANPEHLIAYPKLAKSPQGAERKASSMEIDSVKIGPAAIDTMKRCLSYKKEDRLTIPELLQHPFLHPQTQGRLASTSSAMLTQVVPPGATSITAAQMRVLVDWVLTERGIPALSSSDRTAEVSMKGQATFARLVADQQDLFDQLRDQNSLLHET